MAKRSVQDLKAELQKLAYITPWEDIKAGEVYHVPPIITLERRDLKILTKQGDNATYRRIGDTTAEERKMHKTSVFARFLVKRKRF